MQAEKANPTRKKRSQAGLRLFHSHIPHQKATEQHLTGSKKKAEPGRFKPPNWELLRSQGSQAVWHTRRRGPSSREWVSPSLFCAESQTTPATFLRGSNAHTDSPAQPESSLLQPPTAGSLHSPHGQQLHSLQNHSLNIPMPPNLMKDPYWLLFMLTVTPFIHSTFIKCSLCARTLWDV